MAQRAGLPPSTDGVPRRSIDVRRVIPPTWLCEHLRNGQFDYELDKCDELHERPVPVTSGCCSAAPCTLARCAGGEPATLNGAER